MTSFAPEWHIIQALWLMLAVDGQWIHTECSPPPGRGLPETLHVYGFEALDRDGFVRWLMTRGEDRELLVGAGARHGRGFGSSDGARVLWVRVESKRQEEMLRAFRPSPTLVMKEGATCRLVALWSLWRPLGYEYLVRANERLAHAIGSPRKHAVPEFTFAVPGSCLRLGRARPVPVRVVHFDPEAVFTPRMVVGGLRDAPDRDAWRQAAA